MQRLAGALLAAAGLGSVAVAAQSPTEVAIRIQNMRWNETRRPPNVTTRAASRGSDVRTTAAVTAASRDEARRTARRAALAAAARQALASSDTTRVDADAFAAVVAAQKNGPARVVKVSRTAKGYHVEAEVALSATRLAELLRSTSCSNFRAVVVLPERVDGREQGVRKVETAVVAALTDRRMRVYDWEFASRQSKSASLVRAALRGDRAAALQVGARFVANLVVLGSADTRISQDNEGIISYVATANVRVVQADSGQVLWASEITEKGFGRDRAQAARAALDALAVSAAARVPEGFLGRLRHYRCTVVAQGDGVDMAGVEAILRAQPASISVERIAGEPTARLAVTSRDKPGAVAAALAAGGRYEVTGIDTAEPDRRR